MHFSQGNKKCVVNHTCRSRYVEGREEICGISLVPREGICTNVLKLQAIKKQHTRLTSTTLPFIPTILMSYTLYFNHPTPINHKLLDKA